MRLLQRKQHLSIAESLQALKPIRISPAQQYRAWLEHSQLRPGVRKRMKTPRNPYPPGRNKVLAKPFVSQLQAVTSTEASLLQPCCPLEFQVSLLGCWRLG